MYPPTLRVMSTWVCFQVFCYCGQNDAVHSCHVSYCVCVCVQEFLLGIYLGGELLKSQLHEKLPNCLSEVVVSI